MSQQTYLTFFTCAASADSGNTLRKVLELAELAYCDVTRCTGIDESWRLRHEEDIPLSYDFVSKRTDLADVPGLYEKGKSVGVSGVSKLQRLVRSAVEESIPPELYGGTLPQNTQINVGRHDIFEAFEAAKGQLFGHATLSIGFWGYRHPPKIDPYRAAIMELPIIGKIREELLGILPSVDCRVYMT